jgi:hypothetical protein
VIADTSVAVSVADSSTDSVAWGVVASGAGEVESLLEQAERTSAAAAREITYVDFMSPD